MENISIIVPFQEQRPELMQQLPRLLSMRHVGEYEVILVDMKHDKDTEEWLEEVEGRYPNLCHTFCPVSARCIDTYRLALTLGAKAAAYEWLVVLPVDVEWQNENWLQVLTSYAEDGTDVIIGILGRKRRMNWFKSYIFRRRFSLFRRTSYIILCRRSALLQSKAIKLLNRHIVKL